MNAADALFDQLLAVQAGRSRPPIAEWQPQRVGRIDIRIAADGTWYHEGDPFRRAALVRLFASILRRDPDGYYLVTPAEKLLIEVDDAPFLAIDMEVKSEGRQQSLLFVSNVGDCVVADSDHPIRVADRRGEPRPYVMIRDGLEGLISRSVYYRLVDLAVQEDSELVIYSAGSRFLLGRV